MNCLNQMIEEHNNIKRMLAVIRRYCYKILINEKVQYEDFYKIIDFIRNYADRHHHGKEEKLLFNRMMHELGPIADKLVRYGMLVEHDLGRLHVQELETAVGKVIGGDDEARLDVIANAVSYAHLLNQHIDKEDGVVYKYAEKNLSTDTLEKLEVDCNNFELDAEKSKIQNKYLNMLRELEDKTSL